MIKALLSPLRAGLAVAALSAGAIAGSPEAPRTPDATPAHWAFQPIVRPPEPAGADATWIRNAIDRFVWAKLESRGVKPSPPAAPVTLLRRLTLDLIGLPPTGDEAREFLGSDPEAAYESAVARLLGSPHFGERWGRYWLDAARYADSAGHEFDRKRDSWKYRDWVVTSLNADKPYDEFVVEQIAGDLLPEATPEQVVATGFNCLALENYGDFHETNIDRVNAYGSAMLGLTLTCARCHNHKFDPISQREYFQFYAFFNDADDVRLDLSPPDLVAKSTAMRQQAAALRKELFDYQNGPDKDPVSWAAQLTGEQLRSVPTTLREAISRVAADRTPEQNELIRTAHTAALAAFQSRLDERIAAWNATLTPEQRAQLGPEAAEFLATPRAAWGAERPPSVIAKFWEQDSGRVQRAQTIAEIEGNAPPILAADVMQARDGGRTRVFLRGDYRTLGAEVSPGTPRALPPLAPRGPRPDRLDLARWTVSRDNPLAARVQVNRIWQALFGSGLVETSENFGVQTAQPEHLDLLNWLAAEFIDHGWSQKHIIRLIVHSSTYRQSSRVREDLAEADPANRLLARQNRVRLEAEVIRDCALHAAGLLDLTMGGPSVFPYQPDGVMAGRADGVAWEASEGADRYRRTLYTHFWRLTPHPFLVLFDAPDASESCARRSRSNTPVQALTLLNDPLFAEASAACSKRLIREFPAAANRERIGQALEACLGRPATADELAVLEELADQQRASLSADPPRAQLVAKIGDAESPSGADRASAAALTIVSRCLMNTDEFLTRE